MKKTLLAFFVFLIGLLGISHFVSAELSFDPVEEFEEDYIVKVMLLSKLIASKSSTEGTYNKYLGSLDTFESVYKEKGQYTKKVEFILFAVRKLIIDYRRAVDVMMETAVNQIAMWLMLKEAEEGTLSVAWWCLNDSFHTEHLASYLAYMPQSEPSYSFAGCDDWYYLSVQEDGTYVVMRPYDSEIGTHCIDETWLVLSEKNDECEIIWYVKAL